MSDLDQYRNRGSGYWYHYDRMPDEAVLELAARRGISKDLRESRDVVAIIADMRNLDRLLDLY